MCPYDSSMISVTSCVPRNVQALAGFLTSCFHCKALNSTTGGSVSGSEQAHVTQGVPYEATPFGTRHSPGALPTMLHHLINNSTITMLYVLI
mmetsp:Transcript_1449/g.3261  ORF Transcript_1449/g.3261 Transcript_1449/m.3261 type:complete len:92 (-) Transcript_1449:677-952(-)